MNASDRGAFDCHASHVDAVRRRMLAGVGAALMWPALGHGQTGRDVVDDAGRRVRVPARVSRVLAAGAPASILVFAVAPDKLIGWTSPFRPEERPYVPQRYADLPSFGRLTGRGNTANVEVVIAAKPDLILDYGSVRPTLASLADRVQLQTGIPYLLLDGSFDAMTRALRNVGEMVSEPAAGEAWARFAQATLDEIAARVASIAPERRPRVYYGRGPNGLTTGLSGSINMETIERVGAVNVAASQGQGGLVQTSIEQVLAWNPEVVVTTDRTFFNNVWRDPLWQSLPAVKARRVFLSPQVPFGWIDFPPAINRLIGLRWLARVLHPSVFTDDLRPHVREFYRRAYHQLPSDAQLDELVRSAEPRPA